MISKYELKRTTKKKIESNDIIVDNKKTFNLLEEHTSHRCIVISEWTHYVIPCINSVSLHPNITYLNQLEVTNDPNIIDPREKYAKIVLLWFYSYYIQDDLLLNESYWEKCKYVMDNNIFSTKSIQR